MTADLKGAMTYQFIVDTYETERVKVLSVWSMFGDEELPTRPHSEEARGRSIHEQMVHQCVSEDFWFKEILGVEVGAPPLPETETRIDFIRRYAQDSSRRLDELRHKDEAWWEEEVQFFDVKRTRAWIMMRRIAHTAHHRGQQTAMLRMLKHDLHSTYGPTADTGGLMQHHAPTIYAYPDEESLIDGEAAGGRKTPLPGPGDKPPTERRG